MSAAFFFNKNKLWDICDKGHGHEVVLAVTKRVNGGTIGLEDRQKHFDSFHSLMA
jgi:putative chitinase